MVELGWELKCSNFQNRCSQRKAVIVILPLLTTTGFHGNKITNTYPTEPLLHRSFDLQGTLEVVWWGDSAEVLGNLLSKPNCSPTGMSLCAPISALTHFFFLSDLHINVLHKSPFEKEALFLQIGLKPPIAYRNRKVI